MTTVGALIGDRYRLEQPVGRGQGGIVWLAHDTRLQRTVAAKPLSLHQNKSPDTHSGLVDPATVALTEAALATTLRHPAIVTVYEAVDDSTIMWLITEYVPSKTMSELLTTDGLLMPAQASALGSQLAPALHAAHEHGLVHRAIEPATILLADDGGVQITDFVAGAVHQDSPYRAPEVGNGAAATPASDVYSLGATLHRGTVGKPHPAGSTGFSTPSGDAEHAVEAGSGSTDIGYALRGLLLQMLATDPASRPSMTEAGQALTALAQGDASERSAGSATRNTVSFEDTESRDTHAPLTNRPPTNRPPTNRPSRAKLIALSLLAVVLATACGMLLVVLIPI